MEQLDRFSGHPWTIVCFNVEHWSTFWISEPTFSNGWSVTNNCCSMVCTCTSMIWRLVRNRLSRKAVAYRNHFAWNVYDIDLIVWHCREHLRKSGRTERFFHDWRYWFENAMYRHFSPIPVLMKSVQSKQYCQLFFLNDCLTDLCLCKPFTSEYDGLLIFHETAPNSVLWGVCF